MPRPDGWQGEWPAGRFYREPWYSVGHDVPLGRCAKCRLELPISTGADGAVIASLGYCPECKITTVWEITDAT